MGHERCARLFNGGLLVVDKTSRLSAQINDHPFNILIAANEENQTEVAKNRG